MVDPHVREIRPVQPHSSGCEECLRLGTAWVHLRLCLTCGHVGCCDSSPNQHASKHRHESGHNMMRGIGVGDAWTYDYATGKTEDAAYG